jgi:hypothetical protein
MSTTAEAVMAKKKAKAEAEVPAEPVEEVAAEPAAEPAADEAASKKKPRRVAISERGVPLNVRVPKSITQRMDHVADLLGTDRSHLLRMMLVRHLPAYEREAQQLAEGVGPRTQE